MINKRRNLTILRYAVIILFAVLFCLDDCQFRKESIEGIYKTDSVAAR